MNLFPLLRFYSRSFWLSEAWKSIVTLFGMSLGIALFVGIQLANRAALSSFESSAGLLRGGADLEIAADSGEVAEEVLPKLRAVSGIENIEPISRRLIEAARGEQSLGAAEIFGVNMLGGHGAIKPDEKALAPERSVVLDMLRRDDVCWVSSELKEALGDSPLDITVLGKRVRLTPIYVLPKSGLSTGKQIFLDISRFQDLFHTWGYVDTLQVFLSPSHEGAADKDLVESHLRSILPDHLGAYHENQNARHASTMTEAFRLNLQFLSSISLFVAVLLVYNTMSFFVLKRRRDLGILQSLGVSPRSLRILLFTEASTLGLLSSLIGIVLGSFSSRFSLQLINGTLKNIYGQLAQETPTLGTSLFLQALLLGPLLSVFGTFGPSREVFSVSLRETFSPQSAEGRFKSRTPVLALLGVFLLLATYLSAQPQLLRLDTRFGFLSPSFAVFSACALLPWALIALLTKVRSVLPNLPLPLLLASDHVLSTPRRNSVAIASVMVALGMGFSLTVMIASFRDTVGNWIAGITKADIYISGHFGPSTGIGGPLSDGLLDSLRTLPEVKDYDPISSRTVSLNGQMVRLTGCRMEVIRDSDRLLFQQPMNFEQRAAAITKPDAIFVSEVFARRTGKTIGDRIELPGRKQSFSATIENIFYDFSSDQGVIILPIERLRQLNGEAPLQGFTLYLHHPEQSEDFAKSLETRLAPYQLKVRNNIGLRNEVLRIFDETFRITYALQAIALLVSVGTLLNTLSMLALERTREFAVFRAIGASARTIITMILAESLLLALLGFLGGVALGLLLSVILVYVVNVHFFGWSIAFHVPLFPFLSGGVLLLLLGSFVGIVHGRKMIRTLSGELLRYE